MKYELVIFDLDGTILDTLEDLTDSINYVLKKHEMNQKSRSEVRKAVGNGIYKLVENVLPDGIEKEKTELIFSDFKEYYTIHCADKTKPYDGIEEMLSELKKKGYKLAVVSNKADFAVKELCNKYFTDMFDIVLGERENIARKPAPDSIYKVLDSMCIKKENAVYIGDSEVDIETAKNAGIREVAVTWGFRNKDLLKEKGANLLVQFPKDILNIV